VADQKTYQVQSGWLKAAIEALKAANVAVLVPREEDGAVRLQPVNGSSDGIASEYVNTVLPLKRAFLPASEVLLEYKQEGANVELIPVPIEPAETVVIGSRPCDAAALEMLDSVFQWDYDDLPYRTRREHTTIVTFACAKPDATCFCTSVGGSPANARGSDVLAFRAADGSALVQVLSPKGEAFIAKLGSLAKPAKAAPPAAPAMEPKFDPEKIKRWLDGNFENKFWAETAMRCPGCGACSYVCPTCHCFDIVDESTWDRGQRRRNWDCCSFALFTKHASGHNPRADQGARYRQRVMHKFKYFPERFGRTACVGCGRCLRTCGVGQNLVDVLGTIEKMKS